MAVTGDILASWTRPRMVMRRMLDMGVREDRALIFLMGASLLIGVAQWPALSRLAYLDPSIPIDARIQEALLAWLFMAPLFFYALALALFVILRLFQPAISGYSVRLALFWTLLATTPASLLFGLARGFLGQSPGTTLSGAVLAAGFLWILIQSLREAAKGASHV